MLLKKIHNRSPWLRLATIIRWNHTRTPAQVNLLHDPFLTFQVGLHQQISRKAPFLSKGET
jgi:hypothetical protein